MEFVTSSNLTYHMSGKFIADSNEWTHYTRPLTDYELMVVTEGTLYIASENEKYTVQQGEYLLMPPTKVQHGFKSSKCSFYWLHVGYNSSQKNETKLHQNSPEEFWQQETNQISIPNQAKLPSLERIIVLLKQLQDSDQRYQNQKLNSFLACAIFTEIELQTKSNQKTQKNFSQDHLFETVKEYITWHLHENLKVSDIAEYFGYNEKYLTTLFHKISGMAIKQFILQTKMERAKIALTETNQQVAQIAYSLGFEDSHNFSNAFKKITGLSPKDYKINYGKEKINREK